MRSGGEDHAHLLRQTGNDNINGSSGSDTIYGYGGNDQLNGGDGADIIYGGDGNDILTNSGLYDSYTDYLYGEAGDDILLLGPGDYANGGSGYDVFYGYFMGLTSPIVANLSGIWSGNTVYIAGCTLVAMEAAKIVYGGQGADSITLGGVAGVSTELYGWFGGDLLVGGAGDDRIEAFNAGVDPYTDVDTIYGMGGNDQICGGVGDYLDGGSGIDTLWLDFSAATTGVSLDFGPMLSGATATIFGGTITGFEHIAWMRGTDYGDTIDTSADNYATYIYGGGGDDILLGNAGENRLYGEADNDALWGGAGRDILVGGAGADTFYFLYTSDFSGTTTAAADLISDFKQVQGDKIGLLSIDAVSGGADDAFAFVGTSAFSGAAGELRYEIASGYTTVYGDLDGDGIADFAIALTGSISLTPGDFIL